MSGTNSSDDQLSSHSMGREFTVTGLELSQWRVVARQQAIAADIPATEVDWFLQQLTDLDRLSLRLESFKDRPIIYLKRPWAELTDLWQQRLDDRVPVQYLTGVAPWRQFSLTVSPAVLIPRPETECLIDLAIAAVEQHPAGPLLTTGHWADLGTGSGAIALGLATALPQACIHAVDQSAEALAIAQLNAQALYATHPNLQPIQFYQGSWLQPLAHLKGQLSGLVSNPPYIPSDLVPTLQPEVAQHEPQLALDGGADGLDCIRHLVDTAPEYLQSGGIWLIEMMAGQAIAVVDLLNQQGSYHHIQIHADLAGIDRFALAYRT